MQQRMFTKAALSVAIAAMAGCSNDTKTPDSSVTQPIPGTTPGLYVVNTMVDAPNVDVTVNQDGSAVTTKYGVDFAKAADFASTSAVSLPAGTYSVDIDEVLPTGDGSNTETPTAPVIHGTSVTTTNYGVNVLVVNGNNSSPQILPLSITLPSTGVGLGSAALVFADAASVTPGPLYLDNSDFTVYVGPADKTLQETAALSAATTPGGLANALVANVSYGTVLDPYDDNEGQHTVFQTSTGYRVRITEASVTAAQADGDTSLVLFDSGASASGLINLPSSGAGAIGMIDNADYANGGYTSPFAIYSTVDNTLHYDVRSTSVASFVNGSDLGSLDITGPQLSPALSVLGFPYGQSDTVCAVAPGATPLDVAAAGSGSPDPQLTLSAVTFLGSHSLFVPTGLGDGGVTGSALRTTLALGAEDRYLATEARIQFVNAASSLVTADNADGEMLVYVSPAGTYQDSDITPADSMVAPSSYVDNGDGTISAGGVPFGAAATFPDANIYVDTKASHGSRHLQSYIELPGGTTYDIRVAVMNQDGSRTILDEALGVFVSTGQQVSEVLVDQPLVGPGVVVPHIPSTSPFLVTVDHQTCWD